MTEGRKVVIDTTKCDELTVVVTYREMIGGLKMERFENVIISQLVAIDGIGTQMIVQGMEPPFTVTNLPYDLIERVESTGHSQPMVVHDEFNE